MTAHFVDYVIQYVRQRYGDKALFLALDTCPVYCRFCTRSYAVGIDTEYMKDGRVFSEYRIRDAISGGDTEAAFGLKNLWSIAPGLRLGTSFERVKAIAGSGQNENTALALALEYTGSPLWKEPLRGQVRNLLDVDDDAIVENAIDFLEALGARDGVRDVPWKEFQALGSDTANSAST